MKEILGTVARDFGTPCYVYFMDQVRQRIGEVRSGFGDRFRISYAVKCNPNRAVLRRMRDLVDALDVSSAGEVVHALGAGWNAGKLGFTGPGKTEAELRTSVEAGVGEIILESVEEAKLLDRIAGSAGRKQRVLARLAPTRVPRGFGLNMGGKPSQFGIDEEDIDPALGAIRGLRHLDLSGFHIYSGTQSLDAAAIVENYAIFVDLFRRVCHAHDVRPKRLVFGSGIGIPYYDKDVRVDLTAITKKTNDVLDALKSDPLFSATELLLETGRYLIGEAGIYITRVVRKKRSRGVDICICDGGMNHHLAAAGHLGVLPRNYRMFKVTGSDAGGAEQTYNLVGPLCTTIDRLGSRVKIGALDAGDVIGIRSSGAYGATISPIHFISHPPPREIIVETVQGRPTLEESSPFAVGNGGETEGRPRR